MFLLARVAPLLHADFVLQNVGRPSHISQDKKRQSHYIYKIHLFIVVVGRLYTVRRTNVPSRCHDRRGSFPAILFLLVNVQPLPRHCNETRLGLTVIWVFFLWDNWSAFALCFFRARRSFQFCRPQTFVCVNASPGRCSRLQQSGWEGVGLTTPSSALILYILSVKKEQIFIRGPRRNLGII